MTLACRTQTSHKGFVSSNVRQLLPSSMIHLDITGSDPWKPHELKKLRYGFFDSNHPHYPSALQREIGVC